MTETMRDSDQLSVTGAAWHNLLIHLSPQHPSVNNQTSFPTMHNASETADSSAGTIARTPPSSQRIMLLQNILHKSKLNITYNMHQKYHNPQVCFYLYTSICLLFNYHKQLEEKEHSLSKNAAHRAVALAQATRLAIQTKECSLSARIAEVEEYTGLF